MGRSTKEVWAADAAGSMLLFAPEKLVLITDPAHPLYDERVHLPVDEGMVQSIMSRGVLQPICAIRDKTTGAVMVSAGRQRTKAAMEANRRLEAMGKPPRKVPVMPRDDTQAEAMEVSAAENAIRRDETPIQRAHKMRAMVKAGFDMEGIGLAFGCSVATVTATLLLLEAHPEVQNALAAGQITAGHAAKLMTLKPEKQAAAVAKVVAAAQGTKGHDKAKAQREAIADATGAAKPAAPGKRDIRAALEKLPPDDIVARTLRWVLGEDAALPVAAVQPKEPARAEPECVA